MAIDRRERAPDATTSMLAVLSGFKSELWTALPGIVQSFDSQKKTCTVQPAIRARVQNFKGVYSWVNLPLLVDCPVNFPSGGGFTLTFPIQKGDECLVIFANRCVDSWWQSGGIQNQAELRMLDISDGFCFVGISSVPKVQPAISTTSVQLRSDDGAASVSIARSTKKITVLTPNDVECIATNIMATASASVTVIAANINLQASTKVSVTAPNIELNAPTIALNSAALALSATAVDIAGALNINGAAYTAHVHGNVNNGPDVTSGVI
jgi:phage baseplate assembly protein gpV